MSRVINRIIFACYLPPWKAGKSKLHMFLRRLRVCDAIGCRAINRVVKLAFFQKLTISCLHVELHPTSKMRNIVELVVGHVANQLLQRLLCTYITNSFSRSLREEDWLRFNLHFTTEHVSLCVCIRQHQFLITLFTLTGACVA